MKQLLCYLDAGIIDCLFEAASVPRWRELLDDFRGGGRLLLLCEVEQVRQRVAVGQLALLLPQLVEERVQQALHRLQALGRVVDQNLRNEVDGVGGRSRPEDLLPRVRLDLRELELGVVRVHGHDLLFGRGSQHLDDLDELVDAGLAWEQRLAQQQLGDHAADAPHVDDRVVVGAAEDQLGRAVVARADVRHVGLALDQLLGRAEVAQLQDVRGRVHQQVLRLDVAVADAQRVDVRQRPEHLVRVELHEQDRHALLHLHVVPHDPVDGLGDVVHDHVEVDFVRLVAAGVERVLHRDDVGVVQLFHNLELSVLVALVLVDLLDGDDFAGF
mmetsp:Transcript_15888/g.18402  ORF Transcript_15888/g.18402 Transcript_15888/m.18402 type:complete len:329 (-) Transcript_15888:80-1066(-)